jgi:hypothetical protein
VVQVVSSSCSPPTWPVRSLGLLFEGRDALLEVDQFESLVGVAQDRLGGAQPHRVGVGSEELQQGRRRRPAGLLQLGHRLLDDLATGLAIRGLELRLLEPAPEGYFADPGTLRRRGDGCLAEEGGYRLLPFCG